MILMSLHVQAAARKSLRSVRWDSTRRRVSWCRSWIDGEAGSDVKGSGSSVSPAAPAAVSALGTGSIGGKDPVSPRHVGSSRKQEHRLSQVAREGSRSTC